MQKPVRVQVGALQGKDLCKEVIFMWPARLGWRQVIGRGPRYANCDFTSSSTFDSVASLTSAPAADEGRERVLLIDIDDVDGLPPFWLPLEQALSAMQATDDKTGEPRGYLWLHAES